MKKISLTCLFLFLFSLSAAQAADPELTEIRFIKSDDNTSEAVTFKLTEISLPKVFGIEGEKPRIVCDFLNTELADSVTRKVETKGDSIKTIRIGRHAKPSPKIRVVLDLIPGPDYDIQQTLLTKGKLFTISVSQTNRDNKTTEEQPLPPPE